MIASEAELMHFLEIYQTRHISKAALRLGLSQPTLTQSIQRLEKKLGAALFHRTKQGVVPTKVATLFYDRAKALVDCWAEVGQGVRSSLTRLEGQFKLGCHPSVAAFTLPTLLRRLAAEAPGLSLRLAHDSSRKIAIAIAHHELDLGYVVNPPRHPDLVLKKMGTDRVTFWKRAGLTRPPPYIFADGNREQVERLLGKTYDKHFRGWSIVESSNLELIRTLVVEGLGVGILPERVASVDRKNLALYDGSLAGRHDEIYLAFRREILQSRAGQELIRLATFALGVDSRGARGFSMDTLR